ncbi:hypothetical protein KIPB_002029, partial [Kipferlia bialata]|eukprot:g2029.t1
MRVGLCACLVALLGLALAELNVSIDYNTCSVQYSYYQYNFAALIPTAGTDNVAYELDDDEFTYFWNLCQPTSEMGHPGVPTTEKPPTRMECAGAAMCQYSALHDEYHMAGVWDKMSVSLMNTEDPESGIILSLSLSL